MRHMLGQVDVQQALSDIEGLRKMLWRVSNEALRKQLETAAAGCRSLLEQAMTTDADVAPGLDCVVKLYEAFEEAKRVPATLPTTTIQPTQTSSAGGQGATILWIVAAGAALVGVVAAIA